MKLVRLAVLGALLAAGPSFAAKPEPKTPEDFSKSLKACKPSCYKAEPSRKKNLKEKVYGCGSLDYPYQQVRIGEGGLFKSEKWSDPELTGVFAQSLNVIPDCNFPSNSGGKFSEVVDWLEGQWEKQTQKPGKARYTVVNDDFHFENERGGLKRYFTARVHLADFELKPTDCGTADPRQVCEAAGSKGARAMNVMRYRIDEAKQLKGEGNLPLCRVAAYHSVAVGQGLKDFREKRRAAGKWADGLTYYLRYDGELDEKAAFAGVDKMIKEARGLYSECGGEAFEPLAKDMNALFPAN